MMQDAGSSSLVYLAWIVGGLLSLFGAMTYAELGAMLPYAGGEYVFIRGAYGDTSAFLYMWTYFAVAKPASIAAVTIGLARTLGFFPAFHWLNSPVIAGPIHLVWSQLFAVFVTWLITGLNYLGIKKAGDFQLVFTILKVVLILIVVVFCFGSVSGTFANFSTTAPNAVGGFTGFMAALIATLWAYDGWSDLTMVAGEVRNPGRSLPIALIGGLFLVLVTTACRVLLKDTWHGMALVDQILLLWPAATLGGGGGEPQLRPRPAIVPPSPRSRSSLDRPVRALWPRPWLSASLSRSTELSCPERAFPSRPRAIATSSGSSRTLIHAFSRHQRR
jgi:hypothetical protein